MISSEDIDTRKQAVMALGDSDNTDAVDLLLEASQDSELSVRYFARKALKRLKKRLDIKEEELESNLENVYIKRQITNLMDEDPKVRIQGALKLSEFKDPELLPQIIKQLQNEEHKHVIATLVKTIGILGDERVIPVLSPYLKDSDGRVRANTIEALEAVQVAKTFELISPLLNDTNSRVVANAAKTLWNFSPLKALTRLREMMKSTDVNVRKSAVFALGEIATVETRRLLAKMLNDADMDVRLQASMSIGKVDEKLSRKASEAGGKMKSGGSETTDLKPTIKEPSEPLPETKFEPGEQFPKDSFKEMDLVEKTVKPVEVAAEISSEQPAVQAELPEVSKPAEKPVEPEPARQTMKTSPSNQIIKDLDSDDEEVRVRAVQAASELKDTTFLPLLEDRLSQETSRYVIATLVKALGHMGSSDVIPQIVPFLDYPDPRVRANAVEGLAMINDTDLSKHIAPLLGDPDNRVRGNVATYLWKNDPETAKSKIDKMLSSPSVWDRESALYAIEKIMDPALLPQVKKLLKDKSLAIVRKAANLLGSLEENKSPTQPPAPKVKRPVKTAFVSAQPQKTGKSIKFIRTLVMSVCGLGAVILILGGGFYLGIKMAAENKDKLPIKVSTAKPVEMEPALKQAPDPTENQLAMAGNDKSTSPDPVKEPADSSQSGNKAVSTSRGEPLKPSGNTVKQPQAAEPVQAVTSTGSEIDTDLSLEEALALRDIFGDNSIPLPEKEPSVEAAQPEGKPDQDAINEEPAVEKVKPIEAATSKSPRPHLLTGLILPRTPPGRIVKTTPVTTGSAAQETGTPASSKLKDQAFSLMDRGEITEAIGTFKQAVKANPEDTEAIYYIGHLLLEQREYNQSVTYFDQAIKLDQQYVDAYFMKGRAFYMLGQSDKAVNSYLAGLKIRPDDISAMQELARIYEHNGKLPAAAAIIEKAIEFSGTPNLKFRLGQIYLNMRQLTKAKSLAEEILKQNPDTPQGYNLLGEYYLDENDLDQASQFLEKGLQLKKTPEGHKLLAQIHLARHAYGTARQHLNQVIQYMPHNSWALFNRGRILRLFGDLDGAIPDLERALALNPNDLPTQAHLADCYLLKKRFNDATGLYQQALDMEPPANIAGELRERLSLAKSKRVPGSLPSVW